MKPFWKNEKGIMLIWFYLLIAVLAITGGSLYALSFQESQLTAMDQARNKAFYLAEAGLDRKLRELRIGNSNAIATTSLGDGTYSATYNPATKQIQSTATVNGITKTLIAVVLKQKPAGVRGAITSVGDIAFNGSIDVDGRDHDSSGNLTGDPGTYGASSGGTVTQGGSSTIGGNGFAPAKPANPAAVEQNADNIFMTPEEVLGLQPGSLDQYKTSTPPATPFNGIVYLTADSWIAPDFGTADNPSTGIFILHNASGSALLKNIHGNFKGLIIADDLVHINGDAVVIGGVVLQKQTGNVVGNGSAHVNYSSEVLSNLPTANYTIVSWEDTQNTAYTYS